MTYTYRAVTGVSQHCQTLQGHHSPKKSSTLWCTPALDFTSLPSFLLLIKQLIDFQFGINSQQQVQMPAYTVVHDYILPKLCIFVSNIYYTLIYPTAASSLQILNVVFRMSQITALVTTEHEKKGRYIRVQQQFVH